MTQLSVTPKQGYEALDKMVKDLQEALPQSGRLLIFRTLLSVRNRMTKRGDAPTYPIKWDSEKQRRAFFATDGFGRGIPTTRTNRYTDGWKVVKRGEGYSLVNDSGYAQWVGGNAYGLRQSNIHQGRWRVLRDEFEQVIKDLPEELADEMLYVSRRVVKAS